MRILVTGSEGTLGKVLVRELRKRGYETYGCDLHHTSDLQYMRTDISEQRQLDRVFDWVEPTIVYHLAAEFGRKNGQDYYEQLWKTNVLGTRNVIDQCIKHNAHLVFASSSEVYGDKADSGVLYESDLHDSRPRFFNEYALSKWTNEQQLDIAGRVEGLKYTILRFFNAWGEGELYSPYRSVVCLFTYRLMHGLPITVYKDYHRVFMHSSDWVNAVANVADRLEKKWLAPGDTFNIGGLEYQSVEYLVDLLLKHLGGSNSDITYIDKETANIVNKRPNIGHAMCVLGHNPKITLEQGIGDYIGWMSQQELVRW